MAVTTLLVHAVYIIIKYWLVTIKSGPNTSITKPAIMWVTYTQNLSKSYVNTRLRAFNSQRASTYRRALYVNDQSASTRGAQPHPPQQQQQAT